MKVKVFLLTFALMLTSVVLVGCTKTTETKTVKPTQPTQSQTQTKAPTQPTQKVKADLAKPVISVKSDNSGVEVQAVEHATKIQVKVDDDQWADGTFVAFSTSVGEHVVKFKAVGNDDYNDSISDEFRYETKVATVTVTKSNSSTATIAKEGMGLKIDGEASTETSFSVTSSGIHAFQALGGWDNQNKKFYKDSDEIQVVFAVEHESASQVVFNSSEITTAGEMADEFVEIKKYGNAGWETTTASVGQETINVGEPTSFAVLNFWNNQVAFRYTLNIANVKDLFDSISLMMIGNDVSNVTLQLRNTQNGVYATYDLGVVDSNVLMAIVGLNDTKWKVHWGENTINGFGQALSLVNMVSVREVLGFFDKLDIIVKGDDNNKSTKAYVLEVAAKSGSANANTAKGYAMADVPMSLIATSSTGVNTTVRIISATQGGMSTLNLTKVVPTITSEYSMGFTYEREINEQTGECFIKVTSEAQDENQVPAFTLKLKAIRLGSVLKAVEVTGLADQLGLLNAQFSEYNPSNLHLDFEEVTTDSDYNDPNWKVQQYKSTGWEDVTGQMRSRGKDGSRVVNCSVGGNAQTFTYTIPQAQRGIADAFAVRMGNYWTSNAVIKLKIKVVGVDGTEVFLVGSSSAWYEFKVTTGLNQMVAPLPKAMVVAKIVISTQKTTADTYLYVDDIRLGFAGYAVDAVELNPVEAAPLESLSINFENATAGAFADEHWKREKYTTKWETFTTGINVAEVSGNKIGLFYGAYSTAYMYTYTPDQYIAGVNHIEFDYGNAYQDGLGNYSVKIKVILKNGTQQYLVGSADAFATVEYAAELHHFSLTSPADLDVAQIVITVKNSTNGTNYFVVDNILINHVSD